MANIAAVILAGGQGSRIGGDVPKQYLELCGKPILKYSIEAFEESDVDDIFIVADSEHADLAQTIAMGSKKVRNIIIGGEERYDSVYNALEFLNERYSPDVVLIHDGARPFVTPELIEKIIAGVKSSGAAIAAVKAKDTIKIAKDEDVILQTVPRSLCYQAQTPQGFDFTLLWEAYEQIVGSLYEDDEDDEELDEEAVSDEAENEIVVEVGEDGEVDIDSLFDDIVLDEDEEAEVEMEEGEEYFYLPEITDDAGVFEMVFPGKYIKLIDGGYENFKITTKEDLEYAEYLMEKR